jgi:hypothetical protein
MATLFEYKCKGCGYTVAAHPKMPMGQVADI